MIAQLVLIFRFVVVAENVGLELVLEHFGKVVDHGVEHGDRLAAGAEQIRSPTRRDTRPCEPGHAWPIKTHRPNRIAARPPAKKIDAWG